MFGGYTPCILWQLNDWTREKYGFVGSANDYEYGKDDTLTTCLFKLETWTSIIHIKKG